MMITIATIANNKQQTDNKNNNNKHQTTNDSDNNKQPTTIKKQQTYKQTKQK